MSKKSGFMKALKCRECGREYPLGATHVCEFDFGPLEVAYDYDKIKKSLTKDSLAKRPQTMWRSGNCSRSRGAHRGNGRRLHAAGQGRPLGQVARRARGLGEKRRRQLPYTFVQGSRGERGVEPRANLASRPCCASTGNLANSVAANAASAGLDSFVFIPTDLEEGKILNSLIYGARVVGIQGH